jgi:hypothetical protein
MKNLLSLFLVAAALLAVMRVDGGPLDAGELIAGLVAAGLAVWPLIEAGSALRAPAEAARKRPRFPACNPLASGLSDPVCARCGAR